MCDKCKPIDDRIGRYQFLQKSVTDEKASDAIGQLIQRLQGEKNELHPKSKAAQPRLI
jgi:hypothetical protein